MSLGFARDSLANLLSLVNNNPDDDDGYNDTPSGTETAGHSTKDLSRSNNGKLISDGVDVGGGGGGNGGIGGSNSGENSDVEEFFFFDDEENDVPTSIPVVIKPPTPTSMLPFPTSSSYDPPPPPVDKSILSPSVETTKTTNTNGKKVVHKKEGTMPYQHRYNKLTYAGLYDYGYNTSEYGDYGDYYCDPYAITSFSTQHNQREINNGKKENLFCCFFPAANKRRAQKEDDDDSDDSDSSDDQFEDVNSVVSSSLGESDTADSNLKLGTDKSGTDFKTATGSDGNSQVIDDDNHNLRAHGPKLIVENIDDFRGANTSELPPPNPRLLSRQRTDSFSTARSIPSAWSSPSPNPDSKQDGKDIATAAVTKTAPPGGDKNKTSIVKKRIPITDAVPLKGILKKTNDVKLTMSIEDSRDNGKESRLSMHSSMVTPPRRHLFPTYQPRANTPSTNVHNSVMNDDATTSVEKKVKKNVKFQPMSRVVTVKARGSMSFMEKCQIWWQKPDYEDFKKAARIIAKAMVQGGSEIWLQTSDSWGRQKQIQQQHGGNRTSAGISNTLAYRRALTQYGVAADEADDNSTGSEEDGCDNDKWWCKFGHSRRGLEHIVSVDEGRQRHKYVTDATRAVLEEQRRQRLSSKDSIKIASVSLRHTSWARELAFAAGAADDEAVRSKFCTKAKSRILHLHENLRIREKRGGTGGSASEYRSAHFILSANPALTSLILDENTSSARTLRKNYLNKANKSDKIRNSGSSNDVFNSHQIRKLDEYHDANMGENKEADITRIASGFGAPSKDVMLLRYKV